MEGQTGGKKRGRTAAAKKKAQKEKDVEPESDDEPKQKRVKKAAIWNADCPVYKNEVVKPARSVVNPETYLEADGSFAKLKGDICFGKIRGKKSQDKKKNSHFSVPVFVKSGKNIVKPVRFSFTSPHVIAAPTQFTEKGVKAKPEVNSTWNSSVPVESQSKRDDFNCKAFNAIVQKFCDEALMVPAFWKSLEYDNDSYGSEVAAMNAFKSPIVDSSWNSEIRIKFGFHPMTKVKHFTLLDCRTTEKTKSKGKAGKLKQCHPNSIKGGNAIEGTYQLDDFYVRPDDGVWGATFNWVLPKLTDGVGSNDAGDTDLDPAALGDFDEPEKLGEDEEEEEEEEEEEGEGGEEKEE